MPITLDIEENSFLKELSAGEQLILRRQFERRFGPPPAWTQERIGGADTTQFETCGLRLLEARALEEVLR